MSGKGTYTGGVVGFNIESASNCFYLQGPAQTGIGGGGGSANPLPVSALADKMNENGFNADPWTKDGASINETGTILTMPKLEGGGQAPPG